MHPRFLDHPLQLLTPASGDDYAELVSTLLVTASLLVLVLVPVYHLMDIVIEGSPRDLLWIHASWRLPPVLVAVAALITYWRGAHQSVYKAFLRALAFAVMTMVLGMFSADLVHDSGQPSLMARGIIICTFAISLVSISGARELLVIFGLPFLTALAWIAFHSVDLRPLTSQLIDVLTALFIALIISEALFKVRRYQYQLQVELAQQANTDPLTRLANRRVFEDRLEKEKARSQRHGDSLSIVIGDLDHFKRVNDTFGHAVGDKLLLEISRILQQAMREEDLAVRWGGEEFLLMLPATDLERAGEVAERIRSSIAAGTIDCNGHDISVTISFGVAQLKVGEETADLIRRADEAMYRAKEDGRNRVCLANGDNNPDPERPPIA